MARKAIVHKSRKFMERYLLAKKEGRKIGMFRPITLWPSPATKLKEIGKKFDKILVTELNMGQYSDEIERIVKKDFVTLFKANGRPISPTEIINKVKEAF